MRAILLASLLAGTGIFARPIVVAPVGERPDFVSYLEEVPTPREMVERIHQLHYFGNPPGDVGDDLVIVDQIINLGEKIWSIIEKNKPVEDVQYKYANALPKGANPGDLEGFSSLQYRSYRQYGKNTFGATVYDVTYTAIHRYKGDLGGVGQYLENVTVLPHKVSVGWGYTLNLGVGSVSTVNVGTHAEPIGDLTMELKLKVSTVMKIYEYNTVFEFRGDSAQASTIPAQ